MTDISDKQIPDLSSLQQSAAAHSFRSHVLSSCWEAEQLLNIHQSTLQTEALLKKQPLVHSWPLQSGLAPIGTRVSCVPRAEGSTSASFPPARSFPCHARTM